MMEHKRAESLIRLGVSYRMSFILDNPFRRLFANRKVIVKNANIKKGSIVLEIGCGPGFFTETISGAVGDNGRVYVLDVQKEMLEKIKSKIRKGVIKDNVQMLLANASKINLPSNSVDVVFVVYAFEELNKKEKSIEEFYRVCKRGGHLAFREHKFLVKKGDLEDWLAMFIKKGFKMISRGETLLSYFAEFEKNG